MRILKFDSIHPYDYLRQKQQVWGYQNLAALDLDAYRNRLIALRSNFSDFYTYYWNESGWVAEEFFINDALFLDKTAEKLFGTKWQQRRKVEDWKNKVRQVPDRWRLLLLRHYLHSYRPDVIFVREHTTVPSAFWHEFTHRALLVCRLAAPMPKGWHPQDWDVLYTSTEEYKTFFELHNVPTIINANGFDERVCDELAPRQQEYDVTFVGGLGKDYFASRTAMMEKIAGQVRFKWWGYGANSLPPDSALARTWQGITSGLEMYQIYRNSRIVLNDYIEMANGKAVNQRIFEVMGVGGGLLLTRASCTLDAFPKGLFVTFDSEKDCLDKVAYFLKNEREADEMAAAAQRYLLEHYSYRRLMQVMQNELHEAFERKFAGNTAQRW